MNPLAPTARSEAVRAALASIDPELIPEGNSGWHLRLSNGAAHFVTAKTDGEWLVLETDLIPPLESPFSYWEALAQNASLGGLAKLVLSQDGHMGIRADLPLLDGVEYKARIVDALNGFRGAWSGRDHCYVPPGPSREDAETPDLKRLCAEAGWAFTERAGGKLAVELEVPAGFYPAALFPAGPGVRVSCDLTKLEGISEPSRLAIAGLLLAASGYIRLGRASVNKNTAAPVAQFEVLFGTAPCSSEISSALESLSVACSLCGEEIKSLQDPVVAERYLALRGWDPISRAERNERTIK